jgi:hypothetical protein
VGGPPRAFHRHHQADTGHHDRAADQDRRSHLLAQDESPEDHGDHRVDVGVGRDER